MDLLSRHKIETAQSVRLLWDSILEGKSKASKKILLTKYKKSAVDYCLKISEIWHSNELGNRWYLGEQVTRRQVTNAALEVKVLFEMRAELDK